MGVFNSIYRMKPINRSAASMFFSGQAETRKRRFRKKKRKAKCTAPKRSASKQKSMSSCGMPTRHTPEIINFETIRKKFGTGHSVVDKVRYCQKGESKKYELQARTNGVWLRVAELIAIGKLDRAGWGRFAGLIGKEQCQVAVPKLLKFYKLSVPSSVQLSAIRAKARIDSGVVKLKGGGR